jgi:SSS family solute:Na+ symporter
LSSELLPLTAAEIVFILLYLCSLLLIGYFGWRAKKANSLQDFFLGGQSTGLFVLLLTLYATQYSGNTLFGFTGKTYRVGYSWAVSIQFMMAIVVVYLTFAPRLFAISRRHGFITPSDYLDHRYRLPLLSLVASVVMIVAIGNFLLAQMMAMGKAVDGLFDGNSWIAYAGGVVFLAGIILVYETLGGFRAVAWTDAIQGSILLVGFIALLFVIFQQFGSLDEATQIVAQRSPEKVSPPRGDGIREWISYCLMVGIGGALYPQSVQRIYSAKSAKTLRLSLAIMVFLPLVTTIVSLVTGIIGQAYLPDLSAEQSDSLLTILCREIQQNSVVGRWVVVLVFAAILAAIMSTADSILLSISSMLTKDIYAEWIRRDRSEAELMKIGKYMTWGLIALAVAGAILLRDKTLVQMLDRKLDLLVQLSPAFILGIWWRRLRGIPVLLGILTGIVIALAMVGFGYTKLLGVHPGLFGLVGNIIVAVAGSWLFPPVEPDEVSNTVSSDLPV